MKLDEILDKALPFKFTVKPGIYRARFKAGDSDIVFEAENEAARYFEDGDEDEGEWTILFGRQVKGKRDLKFDLTNGGNEFEIFATLKAVIANFVSKCDPKVMQFSAEKSEPARARIYQKMFSRNLPSGWKIQKNNDWEHATYFDVIKEALDKPLPFKVDRSASNVFLASFDAGNRGIEFEASRMAAKSWEVSFNDDKKVAFTKTGLGNEFAVFATVKAIIEKFISMYDPEEITIDSTKAEPNRAKLYQRMIKKNIPNGWKVKKFDSHPSYTSFSLIREGMMKRSDPYISGEKAGPRPPDVELSPRPTTAHRSKLETLVKKSGKSFAVVEKAWNKAVRETADGPKKWANVMLRAKADLGISE